MSVCNRTENAYIGAKSKILNFLKNIVYLNIVVALSAGILSAGFSYEIGWNENYWLFGLFAFFATLAVYNGQRLFKVSQVTTPWLVWVQKHFNGIVLLTAISSVISLILGLILVAYADLVRIAIWMAPAVVISFLYVFRIQGKNLRDIPHLKIHLIAFSWVCILLLFPMITHFVNLNHPSVFGVIISSYLYVLAVTIPFDIRDLKYDSDSQKTIPQVLGEFWSKVLAIALLSISAIILVVLTPISASNLWFYLAYGVQLVLVLMMHKDRSDLYCAGWIDGAIGLLGLMYFMN